MLSFIKKKKNEELAAPVKGRAVAASEIPDTTFSEEMLGRSIAIIPSEGKVYSPVDGTVAMVFETKHAISIVSEKGAEILIHIGIDTVGLKGQHFTAHVSDRDVVKKGDLLMEFDIEKIKEAGYDTITPIIICNTDDYKNISENTPNDVEVGDVILVLEKE